MQACLPKRLTEQLLPMHLGAKSKNRRLESVCSPWMQIGLSGESPRSEIVFVIVLCTLTILSAVLSRILTGL